MTLFKSMTREQKRVIIGLWAFAFVTMMAPMTTALLAYIFRTYPDVPRTTIQMLVTAPNLIGMFVSLAIGPIAMKISPKKLLVFVGICNLLYFVVYIIFGIRGPFQILMVSIVFYGVVRGAGQLLMNTLIGRHFPPEKRANLIAINQSVLSAGQAIIGVLAGLLASMDGGISWNRAHLLGLLVLPAIIAFAILVPKDTNDDAPKSEAGAKATRAAPVKGSKKIPAKVFLYAGMGFVFIIAQMGFSLNLSPHIVESGMGPAALVATMVSAMTITSMILGFTYALWQKLFKKWIVPVAYAGAAVGLIVFVLFNTNVMIAFFAAIMMGWGISLSNPTIASTITRIAPRKLVPVCLSIFISGANLAIFATPLVIAAFSGVTGGGTIGNMYVAVGAALIATVISIFLFPLEKKPKSKPTPEPPKAVEEQTTDQK